MHVLNHLKAEPQVIRRRLLEHFPEAAADFIEAMVPASAWSEAICLHTLYPVNASVIGGTSAKCVINMQRLNDIRYINKFLESVNEHMEQGGYVVGCVDPLHVRREQLLRRYPKPFNKVYYTFDYLIMRVWPKLPHLRRLYFALTKGRGRVISEMETYGRLFSCGFRVVDSREIGGRLYFIAEKVKAPDYNMEATYGPFITLKRVGKGGKIVKVYKMRTMAPYSEYVQQFIFERNGAGGIGTGSKFNNDPRITSVGRFMRKYWIDELPMLYNLLRGDLKLFGVRPISQHYFSLFPEDFQEYRKRFKPGLIPPVYVEIPKSLEDTVAIERRYLEAYERNPLWTDVRYLSIALYNIFIKRVRSC